MLVILVPAVFMRETKAFNIFQKIRLYWQYQHPLISECELYIGLPEATIKLHRGIENIYFEKIEAQFALLKKLRNSNNYYHLNTLAVHISKLKAVKNQLINLKSQPGWWENDSKNIYKHAYAIINDIKKELKVLGV